MGMKKWLTDKFLPMWAKETVLADNRSLQAENERLKGKNRELSAYIRGLEKGLRQNRRKVNEHLSV